MFRDMRRSKQQLAEEESLQILEDNGWGVLSVHGDEGYPYGIPVNYMFMDGKIYIHGAKEGHKIDAIAADAKVSFVVVDKDDVVPEEFTTYFRSVVVFGKAKIMEDSDEIERVAAILGEKFWPGHMEESKAAAIREKTATGMMVITPEHITGKECIELVKKRTAK